MTIISELIKYDIERLYICILLAVIIPFTAYVIFYKRGRNCAVRYSLTAEIVYLILFVTLFSRFDRGVSHIEMSPWWTYKKAIEQSNIIILADDLLNIVLFVPVGMMLSVIIKKKSIFGIIIGSIMFSFGIEVAQLITRRGWFEIEDIIHNTVGAVVGYCLFSAIMSIKFRGNKMQKTSLLIMAAGIGSRFGTGIKQLAKVDNSNHIIMDYSIHDAIEAGFNEIIFIIRRDIETEFKSVIGERIEGICAAHNVNVSYVYQEIGEIPGELPADRTKPWGTGQAVLATKELIRNPFAVINADDYYGKEAYRVMHDWLILDHESNAYAMAGFILKNTLSDNGGVTRGVCKIEEGHTHLSDVVETSNIIKVANGVEADGVVLNPDSYVSMNFWGFPGNPPEFISVLEKGFISFFEDVVPQNPLKSEYLLPTIIGEKLRAGECTVKILPTNDTWYGMTYKEDVSTVQREFSSMIMSGVYKENLYSDLIPQDYSTMRN